MPQDNIDRILQKVIKHRMGDQQRYPSPVAISKAHFQFKKGAARCYLPKPPPPKLTAARQDGKKVKMQSGATHRYRYRYQTEGGDPYAWEAKSEKDSQKWVHSEGYEGRQESNMDWYGGNKNQDEENEEPEQETGNQTWDSDQKDDNMDVETMEEGMEDENQWYQDQGEEEEGEENWQQEGEGEYQEGDINGNWDPDNPDNDDQQEWGTGHENEQTWGGSA